VLVVVLAVSRVPAAIVDVVSVIAVRDRHVAAALAVHMAVVLVHRVLRRGLTFVVVTVVPSMQVTVVHVVDVVAVRDRDMSAAVPVDVVMAGVLLVSSVAHGFCHLSRSASQCTFRAWLGDEFRPGLVVIWRSLQAASALGKREDWAVRRTARVGRGYRSLWVE
jgi:hypothetical protein